MFSNSVLLPHGTSNQQQLTKRGCAFISRSILLPIYLLLLASCALKEPAPTLEWEERRQILQGLNNCQARGTFTYHYQGNATRARFFWLKEGADRFRLRLIHPLGKTLFRLERTPKGYRASDAKGNHFEGNAAKLTALATLPIQMDQISDFLLGLPGASDKFELDKQQRVKHLLNRSNQQEIQVDYLSYHEKFQPQLPKKIQVLLPDRKIQISIDDWKLKS